MNNIKEIDLRFGYKSEDEIHTYLENYFGELLRTSENEHMGKYYEFDKYNDKVYLEIKTRRINHNQYPTLMFGQNKLIKGRELKQANPTLRIFFLWRCLDGVYYWELDASEHTIIFSGRTDRGKDERSNLVHIKTEHINCLDSFSLAL
tara:strand:- start:11496 stop:11939 length:444 start_codon:yes stop_codon:yes gene_type:complete